MIDRFTMWEDDKDMKKIWSIKKLNNITTDKNGNIVAEIVLYDNRVVTTWVNSILDKINIEWFKTHIGCYKYIECYELNIYENKEEYILEYRTIIEEKLL